MTTPSENLEKAREMRIRIAKDARELKDARIALRDVLGNAEATLGNASIEYVLRHVPSLGVTGTRKVLSEVRSVVKHKGRIVSLQSWRTAGELTDAEIQAIMRCLPPRVHRYQPKSNEPTARPG